ncbi:MAG: SpoIVB peptidase [Clostridia bacterium]
MKKIKKFSLASISAIFLSLITLSSVNYIQTANASMDEEASLFNKIDSTSASTSEKMLVPLGTNFGIKIYTDGVIVSSLQEIITEQGSVCPAENAGIQAGDYILEINGTTINNNEHFLELLSQNAGETVLFKIKRDEEVFETSLSPVADSDGYRFGMWIRDSAGGIGTLTYYDPSTGDFGGLGHGICDIDSGELLSLKEGEPAEVVISGIDKAEEDEPGRIEGYFSGSESLGSLYSNSDCGIFGTLYEQPSGTAIPIAEKEEVKTGSAQILATIETGNTQYYDIEIESICSLYEDTKNFVIKVTDPELIEITGGIIQGMSGSPIIQDGKIIGAVTHVFLSDPTKGYGIFIENMLETAEGVE